MGKRTRGAALKAKKRAVAAQQELVAETAHQVETQHVTKRTDQELFTLDTTAVPTKVDATAQKKKRHSTPKLDQAKIQSLLKKHTPDELQAMATKPTSKKRKVDAFDLWQDDEAQEEPTKVPQKKTAGVAPPHVSRKPPTRKQQPQQRQQVVAVDVAHSGQSYRPDPLQHQDVIGEALALELRRKEAVEYRNAPISTGLTEETKAILMGDDDDSSSSEDEQDDDASPPLTKTKKKLTRAQRNRQKRIRAEQQELRKRKLEKQRLNELGHIKKINKELTQEHLEKKERKAQVASLKKESHRILGKGVVQHYATKDPIGAPSLPVALSEEITGNLRTLKPKGSLVTDRMESFRDRNMAVAKQVGDKKRIVQGKKRKRKFKGGDYLLI